MLTIKNELKSLLDCLNENHLSHKQIIERLLLIEYEVDTDIVRNTFIHSDDVKTLVENRLSNSGYENVYFTLRKIQYLDDFYYIDGYSNLSYVSFNDIKYIILDMIEEKENEEVNYNDW